MAFEFMFDSVLLSSCSLLFKAVSQPQPVLSLKVSAHRGPNHLVEKIHAALVEVTANSLISLGLHQLALFHLALVLFKSGPRFFQNF